MHRTPRRLLGFAGSTLALAIGSVAQTGQGDELAAGVVARAQACLEAADDPRSSSDAVWRAATVAHGRVAPLVRWLRQRLQNPIDPIGAARTRRLLARVLRRAGQLDAALRTLDRIESKLRLVADDMARAEILDALGRDQEALVVYGKLAEAKLAPDVEKRILLRRALMGKGVAKLAAFAKDASKSRAQRNQAAMILAIMGDQKSAIATFEVQGQATQRFRQQIRRAEWAIEAKDFDAAQKAAQDAVSSAKLSRDRRYALSVLASAYRRDGAVEELLAAFEKRDEVDVDTRRLWIRLLREEGRADDALRLFRSQKASFDSATRRQLLEICRETGREDVLVDAFTRLIGEEPHNLEWRSGLSRHFLEKGERARAIEIWKDLETGTAEAGAKELLAAAYSLRAIGLEDVAERLARLAGKTSSVRSDALMFVFRMHLDAGRQAKASDVLSELRTGNPPRGIRAAIADGYERLGRSDLAVQALEELREEIGGFLGTDLEMKYAILLSRVEREEDALRIWRALWGRMRSTPRGRFVEDRMMTVAARTGTLAKIAIELEDRLEGGKATTEDVELLVRLYIKVGDPASATEIIEVFLKQTGADGPEVLRRKAKIYLACQDYHHYEQVIHQLVAQDPESRLDHLRELAMSQLERGRRDLTVALLPKIREESGEDVQMADEFEAGVYGLCGLKGKALEAYVRGIGRHPERIDTYLLISNLMRETGREMEAARMFQFLAQTAERDDLFTIAIDGILNLRAARNTRVPPKLVRWALRVTLERLATRPHRFYLYRLVTDLAAELNDMGLAIRTLKSALPVAGERRTPVMRELMSKAQMLDPTSRRMFGQTRWTPSPQWNATDYIMVGRRLLGQGDHVPPQTFMSLASVFLREGDVAAAMRTFNRAAEVLDYAEVLREAARVLEDANRVTPALRYYRRLLATGSDDVGLVLKIGQLEEQLGNRREAFAAYRRGIERVLARKARQVSHREERSEDPMTLYRGGNVSADEQALPRLVEGVLLTAQPDELGAFLSDARQTIRDEIRALAGRRGAAGELAEHPRLEASAQVWRQLALGARRLEAARDLDLEVLAAFPNDSRATRDALTSRVRRGYHGEARQLLERSPKPSDVSARLAAGVIDRQASSLSVAAAAKLIPVLLGGEPKQLVDLIERVDTGRMTAEDVAAIPTVLAACVLVDGGDAAERLAAAGLRKAKLTELRPTIGGMSAVLTMVDRLVPGSGKRLLRSKMAAVASSKPRTMTSFLYQFAEIDAAVGGGTLSSDGATELALSLAKSSERYNYYLTNLLVYVDLERRASVAKEIHNALPRSQRPQYLMSCMDYLGHCEIDEGYAEWFGTALEDGLEADGDSIIGGVRLPFGRVTPLAAPGQVKRSPQLMAKVIDVFDKLQPGPLNVVARISNLIELGRIDDAFAKAEATALEWCKDRAQASNLRQLMREIDKPALRERRVQLLDRLAKADPKNSVLRSLRRTAATRPDAAKQVADLRKRVAAQPGDAALLAQLASVEYRNGWFADSLDRYKKLAKLQPKNNYYKGRVTALSRQLRLTLPKPPKAPKARSDGAKSRAAKAGRSTAVKSKTAARATPAARVVSPARVLRVVQDPTQRKVEGIQKLFDKGKKREARQAFRRYWRNFNPPTQYTFFPQNLLRYARGPGSVTKARTVFGRFESMPFVAEEARAALGILGLNDSNDPYGTIVPIVQTELLDIVARDIGKRDRSEKEIARISELIRSGKASSNDVGLLLRLVDAEKVTLADEIARPILELAELASSERLQRLARLCVRRGEIERAERLYRLSLLVGNTTQPLATVRKEVEALFGERAKPLVLRLVDDMGSKITTSQFTSWANSAVAIWSQLLSPAEAVRRMQRYRQRVQSLAKGSRYVGTLTPQSDLVAVTLARAGRFDDALAEIGSWLEKPEVVAPVRRLYGMRVRIVPATAVRRVLAKAGTWTDRPAWLRAFAEKVLEWHGVGRLIESDTVLATLAKELAETGADGRPLASRCIAQLSSADSKLPRQRAAYAAALRSVERHEEADAIEEALLAERALPITRIAALLQRVIERDGAEAGIDLGTAAANYTHTPDLLELLAKTADGLGREEDAAKWRAMIPKAVPRGAKPPKPSGRR